MVPTDTHISICITFISTLAFLQQISAWTLQSGALYFTWILHLDSKLNPVCNLLLLTVLAFWHVKVFLKCNSLLTRHRQDQHLTWQERTESCSMNLIIFLPDFLVTSEHFWVVTQMRLDTVQKQLPTPFGDKEHKKAEFCMVMHLDGFSWDLGIPTQL